MDQNVINSQKHASTKKFTDPDGRVFVYDPLTTLYKPENTTHSKAYENQKYRAESCGHPVIEIRRDWFVFIITTAISIATFLVVACYTYYAALQVTASEAATDVARKALRDSGRSLGFTLHKLDEQVHATNSLVTEQHLTSRPYVGVEGVTPINDPKTRIFRFDVRVKNFGIRPAGDFACHFEQFVGGRPIATRSAKTRNSTLFPTEVVHLIGDIPVSEYPDVMAGKTELVIRVYLSYKDGKNDYSHDAEYRYNSDLKGFGYFGVPNQSPPNPPAF
ncbi:hypothetical protein [Tunturiibacter gelidoferens]|uniref:Uncharacterized protein n=1 Tax=Tunturiibacter gelidiferens TaxID=3069689 RepID=A0ACC5NW71_9BACT|nr:hypothetical protein [Edaphobacter lichenicola]MBB5338805.1 hypothetical protein [Edaphobacter lichenicola]